MDRPNTMCDWCIMPVGVPRLFQAIALANSIRYRYVNDWYSQCLPGNDPPPTTTQAPPPPTTTLQTTTSRVSTISTSTAPPPPTGTGSPAPQPPASRLRVGLNPASVRPLEDNDFELWTIGSETSPTKTIGNVRFSLSIPSSATWRGGWYKFGYSKFLSSLGERLVNEGMSTETGGHAITLSITGLSAGTHTLLSWHNAWDRLSSTASISVFVNGNQVATVSRRIAGSLFFQLLT